MGCCGSQRASFRQQQPIASNSSEASYWTSSTVEFEYSGAGELTVTGPLTGSIYRFRGQGARVPVYGADAPSLVGVPNLQPVR